MSCLNFTALDFETANASRTSVCALGMVKVENGTVIQETYQLIRPEPLFFDPRNVDIHGIKPVDVARAPVFRDYWPEMHRRISGPVIAHNAAFDMSVLRHSLKKDNIPCPSLDYFCTLVISRLVWPQCASHSLDRIARLLNIDFLHHDALEDARACAAVAIAACRLKEAASILELKDSCGFRAGSVFEGGYQPCRAVRKKTFSCKKTL